MTQFVKDYLFNARKVVMDPATTPTKLLDVIRLGDMISSMSMSWVARCSVVQMCIIGGHGERLKAFIGVQYDAAKTRDDNNYMRELSEIAKMFGEYSFEQEIADPLRTQVLSRWAHREAPNDTPFAE